MICQVLSERYGWTPAEIADLTPAQIAGYLQAASEKKSDYATVRAVAQQEAAARNQWIRTHIGGYED